jgi:hypothetical protein
MPPLKVCCLEAPRMNLFKESNSSFRSTVSLGNNTKKSVSFDDNVLPYETIHVNDFTDEEYHAYWLTSDEFLMIMDMAEINIKLMQLGEKQNDTTICYRGLEGRTPKANARYGDKYYDIVASILNEQDYQQLCVFKDEEIIASLCRDKTQKCKDTASARARKDEYAAREYLMR